MDLYNYNTQYNTLKTDIERKQYCQNRIRKLLYNHYSLYKTLPQNINTV